jgi:hypothetical protein
VTGLTRLARTLAAERICLVCRARIPEEDGVWHMDLGLLTHWDECMDIASAARRSYDRSPRGRRHPRAEVLRVIAGAGTLLHELDALERRP